MDSVRDQIGALHMDPLRLLEASSVFDSKNPTSNAFWERWLALEDATHRPARTLSDAERVLALAHDADARWQLALGAAERTGLSYLTGQARRDAERATKMLRLAGRTTSTAEAQTAYAAAAKVLATLNLAHLRTDAVAALTDHVTTRALTRGPASDRKQTPTERRVFGVRLPRLPGARRAT